jgi:periplasmic divalent cation tolerance protein
MDKYILITTTFNNYDEALKVVNILLDKKLVSCCQISDINSFYHWKGDICNDKEYLVRMKSKSTLYKDIEEVILNNHSYEVPEIVSYNINGGYDKYLDWIGTETK